VIIITKVTETSCFVSTSLMVGRSGFTSRQKQGFFSLPLCQDKLRVLLNLIPIWYRTFFPWGSAKLIGHFHVLTRLRTHVAISLLMYKSLWHGTFLSTRKALLFSELYNLINCKLTDVMNTKIAIS
jgi:hypothetical protein